MIDELLTNLFFVFSVLFCFFFFNDTATTEIYTLSLHDALPISSGVLAGRGHGRGADAAAGALRDAQRTHRRDRKSTRLNSSHSQISYAVFCLKKKKKKNKITYILNTKTTDLTLYSSHLSLSTHT